MTELRPNVFVSKNHPRIIFRGALDSLEADILEAQLLAAEQGEEFFRNALEEVLSFVRDIMSAEVNGRAFTVDSLFGLTLEQLHEQSHRVKDFFGFHHPVPSHTMGALPLRLNTLRTRVRETEINAVKAFSSGPEQNREDIVHAMNRLSSAVYWLFCRSLVPPITDPSDRTGFPDIQN
ncbi:MAG: hypothetical protein FWG99_02745 [Treponema sp.]|nr:hypothetical protein [Treponema sp.]